jgi:hypothetical protein
MPIDWAVSGSSNAMPPGPSEPANIPIARNRSNAGTPNRETLLASTLAIRSTKAMSITIVRFNSIPACQLAPNFVSPMPARGYRFIRRRCARSLRLFLATSPCCAAAIFSCDSADAIRFSSSAACARRRTSLASGIAPSRLQA